MNTPITGIHHITAIASDPQSNIDFYVGLLGLRLVKKTVNFDDPSAYHLYYGDETGSPGSILTFFYWPDFNGRGQIGAGQVSRIALSISSGAIDFWRNRLESHGFTTSTATRFGQTELNFQDVDGIPLALVANDADPRTGWASNDSTIPAAFAISGVHSVELNVRKASATALLLTKEMGFQLQSEEGPLARYTVGEGRPGQIVEVLENPNAQPGIGAAGTVHHIAWSVPTDEDELQMLAQLRSTGWMVSEVRDRNYFHSIYYRERNGILFEIATATPGFAIDEPADQLGTALKLPAQFEHHRAKIENLLPPLSAANANVWLSSKSKE